MDIDAPGGGGDLATLQGVVLVVGRDDGAADDGADAVGQGAVGILLRGDVGYEGVDIDFQVGVAAGIEGVAVGSVVGIEAMGGLPFIGHSVLIGICG